MVRLPYPASILLSDLGSSEAAQDTSMSVIRLMRNRNRTMPFGEIIVVTA